MLTKQLHNQCKYVHTTRMTDYPNTGSDPVHIQKGVWTW